MTTFYGHEGTPNPAVPLRRERYDQGNEDPQPRNRGTMTIVPFLALSISLVGSGEPVGRPLCPPAGMTRPALLQLKDAKFAVASADERNRLAPALLACLDDSDPRIRDGVVFEAISTWLRGKQLASETIVALEASLRKTLEGPRDTAGFRHPFAALILSEVARADRIEPVFSEATRAALVELAAISLSKVDDYRGFDPKEGWRHGVAHGSDLVLQLGMNPKVGPDGVKRLMDALAIQVAPEGGHAYTYGEPERLARALVFTHRRGTVDAAYWESWFAAIASPKPLDGWRDAFESLDGLAKRHNTIAFLHAVAFDARNAGGDVSAGLAILADKALKGVMG